MPGTLSMVVIVVLVAGGDDPATTDAAANAARAALPASSSVIVHRQTATDDDAALALERTDAADAVVVLTASASGTPRFRLRVHRRDSGAWLEREISFGGRDSPGERGRTVGFAIASMFPEPAGPERAPPPTPPPPPPTATVASPMARPEAPTPPASPPRPMRALIDAAAIAGVGIEGHGGGVGGRAGFGWLLGERVAIRADASFRRGEVAPAMATSLVLTGGPGLSFDFLGRSTAPPLGLGGRLHALAILHVHSHLSDEPSPVHESRWLPGAAAAIDVSVRLSEGAAVLVSGGTEVAFGRTDVYVHSRKVTTIPPVRVIGDLGIRVRF